MKKRPCGRFFLFLMLPVTFFLGIFAQKRFLTTKKRNKNAKRKNKCTEQVG